MTLIVNMVDEAALNDIEIDADVLSQELGMPVLLVSARQRIGLESVHRAAANAAAAPHALDLCDAPKEILERVQASAQRRAQQASDRAVKLPGRPLFRTLSRSIRVDRWLFHPLLGPATLALTLFSVFEALFAIGGPAGEALFGVEPSDGNAAAAFAFRVVGKPSLRRLHRRLLGCRHVSSPDRRSLHVDRPA